jgi:hypothetical protein
MAGARRTFGLARSYYLKTIEGTSQSLWLPHTRESQFFCDRGGTAPPISDGESASAFLAMLRDQRQRLFFTLPQGREAEYDLWDLTVFRYGGLYLEVLECVSARKPLPRRVMPMLVRGLNRVFTSMLSRPLRYISGFRFGREFPAELRDRRREQ